MVALYSISNPSESISYRAIATISATTTASQSYSMIINSSVISASAAATGGDHIRKHRGIAISARGILTTSTNTSSAHYSGIRNSASNLKHTGDNTTATTAPSVRIRAASTAAANK
jgi:hypothetical protein